MASFYDFDGNGNLLALGQGDTPLGPTNSIRNQFRGVPVINDTEWQYLTFLGMEFSSVRVQGQIQDYYNFFAMHAYQSVRVSRGTPIASATLRLRQNETVPAFGISIPIAIHIATRPRAYGVPLTVGGYPGVPNNTWTLSAGYESSYGPFASPIITTLSGASLDVDCTSLVQAVIDHADWNGTSVSGFYFYVQTGRAAQRWVTTPSPRPGPDDSLWVGGPNGPADYLRNSIEVTL